MEKSRSVPLRASETSGGAVFFYSLSEVETEDFMCSDFDDLTPELFLPVLETALECDLKGFASAFHSYINRVYEVRTAGDGECLVVKFYRPGRWSADAILDEHDYLWECADSDVPVVPPYVLADGSTLGWLGEIPFSVFPKKRGRDVSFESPDELKQAGALVARLHAVGSRRTASGSGCAWAVSENGTEVPQTSGKTIPHAPLAQAQSSTSCTGVPGDGFQ